MWDLFVILLSLGLLMYTAYKGFSVILMAPLCALLAVFLIAPNHVLPFYSGVFMPKMVNFIKDYFLVFLLGAIFGKVVEGMDFVRLIGVVPTDFRDRPKDPVIMETVEVIK